MGDLVDFMAARDLLSDEIPHVPLSGRSFPAPATDDYVPVTAVSLIYGSAGWPSVVHVEIDEPSGFSRVIILTYSPYMGKPTEGTPDIPTDGWSAARHRDGSVVVSCQYGKASFHHRP